MYRAEVEPMSPDADLIPRMGLFKVVIYEGERFVRTDKEYMIISVAERLAEELNYQFNGKRKIKEAGMKTVLLFFFILWSSVPLYAQELNTALMESTFKIIGPKKGADNSKLKPGETQITYGTVFVIGRPKKDEPGISYNVMVTAGHVLDDIDGDTATLVLRRRLADGTFERVNTPIKIRDKNIPLYFKHDVADIAVMYVLLPQGTVRGLVPITKFATDETYDEYDIHPGDVLLTLGYPMFGESNAAGFPILRSGRIASYPLVPASKVKRLLFDFQIFSGNSGGPVYMSESIRVYKNVVHYDKNIWILIGLVSKQLSSMPELGAQSLALAEVVPAQFILEAINKMPQPETLKLP